MDSTEVETEAKEGLSLGPQMGSTEGSSKRELRCTGSPQGAAGQDPDSVSLAEKVSTLGFQKTKRTQCGAAKRWARRARQAESLSGEPANGDTRPSLGGQPHQEETSLLLGGGGAELVAGPASGAPGPSTLGDGGQPTGLGKRQSSSGGHSGRQTG
jgi:hypothetical protein